jgi:methyl acetate hydrolase
MDNLLEAAIQDGVVPGLAALIDHRDGSRYEAGFGEQVHGSGVNMNAETVLWLASMTKAVTGAAVMQQVEHGSLHLDQPASEICHELKDRPVLAGFDENGVPILRPAKGTITLRNLLMHTSGFVDDTWDPARAQYHSVTNTPGVLSCENAALSVPLGFDPGTEWNYGPGIDWAGKMVERVTGQSLGSYMQEHLFTP